jgi:hypothetical protein
LPTMMEGDIATATSMPQTCFIESISYSKW